MSNIVYPALLVNKEKLVHNTKLLKDMCASHGMKMAAVTKVFCGIPELAKAQVEAGADYIADSRVENMKKMVDVKAPKLLLRIPMKSQAADVVKYCDLSLNSELEVIKALGEAALSMGKTHDILLMIDMGDLREGVWNEKAVEYAGEVLKVKGICVKGIGVNLTCYGGVLPSKENIGTLVALGEEIEKKYGVKLEIISGGNSSSLKLMNEGGMPERVNLLRLGESIVLGMETADATHIPGTHRDVFTLAAELVELKDKPSVPIGVIGLDAFGQKPVFTDRGDMKRAIVAIGRQDARIDGLTPRDQKIEIIGASSDHMLLDVTDCDKEYKVGDILEFDLSYGGLLSICTSEYVTKIII